MTSNCKWTISCQQTDIKHLTPVWDSWLKPWHNNRTTTSGNFYENVSKWSSRMQKHEIRKKNIARKPKNY